MPVEAPVILPNVPLTGSVRCYREYRDVLGRPLTGVVTITGQTRTEVGGQTVLPLPVLVEIVGGVLDVNLPPDTYSLVADLRTVEQARATDKATIVLD